MMFVVMLIKPCVWFFAFRSGLKSSTGAMLLWALAATLFLTMADKVSVASNLGLSAIMLTLFLYAVMSFVLIPLAWKVRKPLFSLASNVFGMLGAFAGVNFLMDFLRGLLPFMNR